MAANDIGGALTSSRSQFHHHAAIPDGHPRGLQGVVAGIHERLMVVCLGRMRRGCNQSHLAHLVYRKADRQSAMHFHALDFCNLAMFFHHPELFEHLFELLLVRHREDLLRRDLAMMQLDPAIAEPRHYRVVRHHHDCASLLVKFPQQAQHNFLIEGIKVASGFIGEDDFRIVD